MFFLGLGSRAYGLGMAGKSQKSTLAYISAVGGARWALHENVRQWPNLLEKACFNHNVHSVLMAAGLVGLMCGLLAVCYMYTQLPGICY